MSTLCLKFFFRGGGGRSVMDIPYVDIELDNQKLHTVSRYIFLED